MVDLADIIQVSELHLYKVGNLILLEVIYKLLDIV